MSVYEYEAGEYEGGELEYEGGELEWEGGELEFEGGELEFEGGEFEFESPFHETMELELASELMEIGSEQEMEQFLGDLFKKAVRGVGRFARSSAGRALGGVLKGVAKKALPWVGGALGSFVAPGIGTAIGSKLGSLASGLFEMEFEGLGEQEMEFEAARRFVRLAGTAAQHAARAPHGAPPRVVAQRAVVNAARRQLAAIQRAGAVGAGAPHHRPGHHGHPGHPGHRGTGMRATGMRRPVRSIYGGGGRSGAAGYQPRRRGYRYGYRRPYYAGYGATGYAEPVSGVPTSGAPVSGTGYTSGGYPSPGYSGTPSYGGTGYGCGASSGRWFRRHGKIIIVGA